MLENSEVQNNAKRLLITFILSALSFIGIFIILIAQNLIGLNLQNRQISLCSQYLTIKYSTSLKQMYASMFLLTIFGITLATLNSIMFIRYYVISIRGKQNNQQISQNRLRLYLILNFIQIIFLINILARNISFLAQGSSCSSSFKVQYLILAIISAGCIGVLLFNLYHLSQFLSIIQNKFNREQQFRKFQQQNDMFQNQILSSQRKNMVELSEKSYSSKESQSLKEQLLKKVPSGYKNPFDYKNRYIPYKLLGGKNSDNLQMSQKLSDNPLLEKDMKKSRISEFPEQKQLDKKNKNSNPAQNDPNQSLNKDMFTTFEMTSNTMALVLSGQKSKGQAIENDKKTNLPKNEQQSKASQSNKNNTQPKPFFLDLKKVESQAQMKQKFGKKQEDNIKKQQEVYNIAPQSERKHQVQLQKNPQKVDEEGRFYYIDLSRVKKSNRKAGENFSLPNITQFVKKLNESNSAYQVRDTRTKPKRIQQQHQNHLVQSYKKIVELKEEELELYLEESEYRSLSYTSFSSEQAQFEEKQEQKQQLKEQDVPVFEMRPDKLHLLIQRKQIMLPQNRVKLYDDQQLYYIQQSQQLDGEVNKMLQKDKQGLQQKGEGQKTKIQDRAYRNKELENSQARMLRFIKSKYVRRQEVSAKKSVRHTVFSVDPINETPQNE